jgi:hypothetical protein
MQRFSTQSKLNLAHMTWEHIFQEFYISDSNLVHEMSLRQKGTYCWGIQENPSTSKRLLGGIRKSGRDPRTRVEVQ